MDMVVYAGLSSTTQSDADACDAVIFYFLFQIRVVSLSRLQKKDVSTDGTGETAHILGGRESPYEVWSF